MTLFDDTIPLFRHCFHLLMIRGEAYHWAMKNILEYFTPAQSPMIAADILVREDPDDEEDTEEEEEEEEDDIEDEDEEEDDGYSE